MTQTCCAPVSHHPASQLVSFLSPSCSATVVAYGAVIDARDDKGWTPLMRAVNLRSVHMLELLIDEGANPDIRCNGGLAPIHYAAVGAPDPTVMRLLVEAGRADVNAVTPAEHGQCTALVRACMFDQTEIVRFLTDTTAAFVDLDVPDHLAQTAFDRARQRDFGDCQFMIRRAKLRVRAFLGP